MSAICPELDSPRLLNAFIDREWAVSESMSLRAGFANVHHASPIDWGKGPYPSIVALEIVATTEYTNERAIAEFAKLLMSSNDVILSLPVMPINAERAIPLHSKISDLLIRIQDEVPSLIISEILEINNYGNIVFSSASSVFTEIGDYCPPDLNVLWIPLDFSDPVNGYEQLDVLCVKIWKYIKQFSEAGYPGCEGCIDKEYQKTWDEGAYRSSMIS